MEETKRVLITDPISESGIEMLRNTPGFEVSVRTGLPVDELVAAVRGHDALIVRSGTKVTAPVLADPGKLRAIGRAGTGVDNIDLDAATNAGVVVMNTPGGNSVAAAEQSIALLTALARNVPQAHADLKAGHWNRKKYTGTELVGKTLGVVGLGKIGREVVRRARGLRMDVVGHDPFVSEDAARDLGVRAAPLDELLATADYVSLHLPLTDATRHVIDRERIAAMKPGARLINCARGGLIDEAALLEALESGHLSGAAADVFEEEPPAADSPLIAHPRMVVTPHLGASTVEAQERVGTEIAEKIRDYLAGGVILDAVNFPSIDREAYATLGPILGLAETLGSFLAQASDPGVRSFKVEVNGSFADHPLKPITMAAVKGLLTPALASGVSFVNALRSAEGRGIEVREERRTTSSAYTGLLRLSVETDGDPTTVCGTLFTSELPKIVEIDGVGIEVDPRGHMLLFRNRDVPGVVGRIGTILGGAGVNIAGLHLGRPGDGDRAVSILHVDSTVPEETVAKIGEIAEIVSMRAIDV